MSFNTDPVGPEGILIEALKKIESGEKETSKVIGEECSHVPGCRMSFTPIYKCRKMTIKDAKEIARHALISYRMEEEYLNSEES